MSASAIVQSVHYVSSCGTGAGDVSLLRFGKYISLFCAVADAVTSVGVAIFVHRIWLRPRSQGFIQTNRPSMAEASESRARVFSCLCTPKVACDSCV